jgi:hypothetical protein
MLKNVVNIRVCVPITEIGSKEAAMKDSAGDMQILVTFFSRYELCTDEDPWEQMYAHTKYHTGN